MTDYALMVLAILIVLIPLCLLGGMIVKDDEGGDTEARIEEARADALAAQAVVETAKVGQTEAEGRKRQDEASARALESLTDASVRALDRQGRLLTFYVLAEQLAGLKNLLLLMIGVGVGVSATVLWPRAKVWLRMRGVSYD
jgi:hypothetical protein